MSDILLAPAGARSTTRSRFVNSRRLSSALKVCFISETLHAGVGRHIVDAVTGLSDRGHEVHLLYSPIRLDPEFLALLVSLPNVICHAVPMPRAIGWNDIRAFKQIAAYVRDNGPFD